jgi:hypothetical protein
MTERGINLTENSLEKTLLFLNWIRIHFCVENNQKFFDFFHKISEKIGRTKEKSIESLNELLKSIHCRDISFGQADETSVTQMGKKGIERIRASSYGNVDILNQKSYQVDPEEYLRSHLDIIIPLILYTWSVANNPQFPKDTQIVALLLFIHSGEKDLLEQIRIGEGKTLIVGLTAAFFALAGHDDDRVNHQSYRPE